VKCVLFRLTTTTQHNSFASLPLLVPLLTFPLRILRGSLDRNSYMEALLHFSLYILPIPQLASVITKPLSKQFAVDIGLFLEDLAFLTPLFPRIESQITLHFSIHSLSNLMLFTPPRYSQLSVSCYDAYLRLLSMLLNHLPEVILQGSNRGSSWTNFCAGTKAHVIGVPPGLDSKTQNRLDRVLSSDHICKLLTAADCPSKLLSLATYLPQFCLSWLSQVDNVLHAVATSDATRFARLLYVEKVADMSLGKTYIENPVKLIGRFFISPFHLRIFNLSIPRVCYLRTLGETIVLHRPFHAFKSSDERSRFLLDNVRVTM